MIRARPASAAPASSCPDCLSWGSSYGSQSYCRACYDFTRRYPRGECAGCHRIIALKKGHCRLCWLQAGIAAAGRRRITPADFRPGGDQQLSFAGMNRIGHTGPAPATPMAGTSASRRPAQPPAPAAGTQLQLCVPGESRHFDKAHWVASNITGEALQQARHIAAELAGTSIAVILTGGLLRENSFSLVGPLAEETLRRLSADVFFLGVDGFDVHFGLTTPNLLEAKVNRVMVEVARRVVMVCDSSKFGRRSLCLIDPPSAIDEVITDSGIGKADVRALEKAGNKVTVVYARM